MYCIRTSTKAIRSDIAVAQSTATAEFIVVLLMLKPPRRYAVGENTEMTSVRLARITEQEVTCG